MNWEVFFSVLGLLFGFALLIAAFIGGAMWIAEQFDHPAFAAAAAMAWSFIWVAALIGWIANK